MKTIDEINNFLIQKSREQSISCLIAREHYSKRFNISGMFTSDVMGGFSINNASLEDNLNNLFSALNNNMVAGIYGEYRSIDLEKKIEVVRRSERDQKRLKQAAFLFILKNGLANQFQVFMNNYQGDTEKDIQYESMTREKQRV